MWRCKLQLEIMVSLAQWNPEKLSIYVLVAYISGEIFLYFNYLFHRSTLVNFTL